MSRELDAQVAEKVMGWTLVPGTEADPSLTPDQVAGRLMTVQITMAAWEEAFGPHRGEAACADAMHEWLRQWVVKVGVEMAQIRSGLTTFPHWLKPDGKRAGYDDGSDYQGNPPPFTSDVEYDYAVLVKVREWKNYDDRERFWYALDAIWSERRRQREPEDSSHPGYAMYYAPGDFAKAALNALSSLPPAPAAKAEP